MLDPGEAHLHLLHLDALAEVSEAELLQRYGALLTPEEMERQRRYLFERGRRQHLLTRALLRTTLSRYATVERTAWRFAATEQGRPFIAAPQGASELQFSLSHTDGLIACLVARFPEIGVDVEHLQRGSATDEIADRFFSPREAADLRASPSDGRRQRFFTYWTLKEAYIKARGLGLAIPLADFSFTLEGEAISIAFKHSSADAPEDWQFSCEAVSPDHLCATALRVGSGKHVSLRQFAAIPPPTDPLPAGEGGARSHCEREGEGS